ncbi:alpha/beta hydrolase [Mycobacterium sp. WUMAC-067]|uniref:alpha/beta fold hydrolase n=1 Tax=unclassified Mycobacterium TaxID=2642494 RepID=UPI001CDA0671|nr:MULTISPECIES: alpha/beta hydrolase [unclassified Mycobacterium]MCA2244793.1 alpha/beta hydrolase [Mycobacterium sp. WUMAC-067]MCA2316003.1 alpha/beta hydrolase [Mycobacterium sp. WUMAC-025]
MIGKPPLLLLHGVTMSAAAWDNVTPLLADRFELIVPTAAGHRGGPKISGPATIRALTDVTERLLDDRKLATVHIAGNSMGGWMAIELARRGRAGAVCAISPAGLWNACDSRNRSRDTLRRTKKLADATRHLTPSLLRFGALRRLTMADIAVHAERLSFDQAVRAFNDLVGCDAADDLLDTTEHLETLDPLPCPITVAWSAKDRIFPPDVFGANARRRLPNARFIMLPGVGHVPMIDDPAMCAQTIIDSIPDAPTRRDRD